MSMQESGICVTRHTFASVYQSKCCDVDFWKLLFFYSFLKKEYSGDRAWIKFSSTITGGMHISCVAYIIRKERRMSMYEKNSSGFLLIRTVLLLKFLLHVYLAVRYCASPVGLLLRCCSVFCALACAWKKQQQQSKSSVDSSSSRQAKHQRCDSAG